MPETAIYKNRQTEAPDVEIGLTRQPRMMNTVAYTSLAKKSTNQKLRLSILAANARHIFRPAERHLLRRFAPSDGK